MGIEASFTATAGEFPLSEVFEKFPASEIELDRVVPTNQVIIPYFWLRNIDSSEIDMEGIDHPGINEIRRVDDVNEEALVRIEWEFDYESILTAILETDVALISAVGEKGRWTFEVRGEDQQEVSEFQ